MFIDTGNIQINDSSGDCENSREVQFPSHIIICTKSKPSLKALMRMVEMMPSKIIAFKWLTIA